MIVLLHELRRNAIIIRKHRASEDVVLLRSTTPALVNEWTKEINGLLQSVRSQSLRSRTAITNSAPITDLYQPHAMSRGQSYHCPSTP